MNNPKVVDRMLAAVFDSPFMAKAHKNKKCTMFTDEVQEKKLAESRANRNSMYVPCLCNMDERNYRNCIAARYGK